MRFFKEVNKLILLFPNKHRDVSSKGFEKLPLSYINLFSDGSVKWTWLTLNLEESTIGLRDVWLEW